MKKTTYEKIVDFLKISEIQYATIIYNNEEVNEVVVEDLYMNELFRCRVDDFKNLIESIEKDTNIYVHNNSYQEFLYNHTIKYNLINFYNEDLKNNNLKMKIDKRDLNGDWLVFELYSNDRTIFDQKFYNCSNFKKLINNNFEIEIAH